MRNWRREVCTAIAVICLAFAIARTVTAPDWGSWDVYSAWLNAGVWGAVAILMWDDL